MRRWAKTYDSKKELPQFVHLANLRKFLEDMPALKSLKFYRK